MSFLAKPSLVISAAFVIALVVGLYFYNRIGQPPVVSDILQTTASSTPQANGNVSLSFNISGHVKSVAVKIGDKVYPGEVLATLDASVAKGAVDQAKGALDLAKAQYGSLSIQYQNAKVGQDLLVKNAYRTLLSSGLEAFPVGANDETHSPVISGTYTCDKEGSYEIDPYPSGTPSGYSFNIKGLEIGSGDVTYGTPQPFGTCGLVITFVQGFVSSSKWTVSIPNIKASTYQANKNAYDLAVSTRTQVLSQLSANLGQNGSTNADIANATISAAQGAYDAAKAQYDNSLLTSPVSGSVNFLDTSLKVGQSITAAHPVISLTLTHGN